MNIPFENFSVRFVHFDPLRSHLMAQGTKLADMLPRPSGPLRPGVDIAFGNVACPRPLYASLNAILYRSECPKDFGRRKKHSTMARKQAHAKSRAIRFQSIYMQMVNAIRNLDKY